jgi:hypothetical protein
LWQAAKPPTWGFICQCVFLVAIVLSFQKANVSTVYIVQNVKQKNKQDRKNNE